MERVKSYKYSVKLKEDVDISELLYVMSNPREVGIYFSKTIPHNNVIVIYAGTEKMTFPKLGNVFFYEEVELFLSDEYDDFNEEIRDMLYELDDDKVVYHISE